VAPGSALILGALFLVFQPERLFVRYAGLSAGGAAVLTGLSLIVAYVVGMVVDVFAPLLMAVTLPWTWKPWLKNTRFGPQLAKHCKGLEHTDLEKLRPMRVAALMADLQNALKTRNEYARSTLGKLQAEQGFSFDIATVFLILSFVSWLEGRWLLALVLLLLFPIMCINGCYRTMNLWTRQVSFLDSVGAAPSENPSESHALKSRHEECSD
jgi:hypothetical protein